MCVQRRKGRVPGHGPARSPLSAEIYIVCRNAWALGSTYCRRECGLPRMRPRLCVNRLNDCRIRELHNYVCWAKEGANKRYVLMRESTGKYRKMFEIFNALCNGMEIYSGYKCMRNCSKLTLHSAKNITIPFCRYIRTVELIKDYL